MSTYRGPDRRRSASATPGSPTDASFQVALAVIVAWFALLFLPGETSSPVLGQEDHLSFAAAATVAICSVLLISLWRADRRAPTLWCAIASAFAAATIVARSLAASSTEGADLRSVALACAVGAVATGITAAATPTINASLVGRVPMLLVAALAGAVALSFAFATLGLGLPTLDGGDVGLASLAATAGWAALAGAWFMRGRKDGEWFLVWMALLALTMAISETSPGVADLTGRSVSWELHVLLLVGALFGARGAARSVHVTMTEQAHELHAARHQIGIADRDAESARAAAEERAHEARNALSAVGGAIQVLERHHERLDPSVRSKLADGIAQELERLQRLVDVDEASGPPRPFRVDEAVMPVVQGARCQGLEVRVAVPAGVVAFGSPTATAEIVQNLLVNAMRHAGGIDVEVRSSVGHDRVVITVSDGGPGVPEEDRTTVFDRNQRGGDSTGRGLGLYVCRRLARAQGGEIWVDDRPGGGAVFGFDVALASGSGLDGLEPGHPADAREELGDVADVR